LFVDKNQNISYC